MKKRYWDLASGIFLFLFSIILFVGAMNVKTLEVSTFGSGFFPKVVAVLLAVTSIPIILGGVLTARKGDPEDEGKGNPRWQAVLSTFAIMVAYAALMPIVGFMISTTVYLFIQINILSEKKHRRLFLFGTVSVTSSVAIYFLFVKIFNLMLPAGILG